MSRWNRLVVYAVACGCAVVGITALLASPAPAAGASRAHHRRHRVAQARRRHLTPAPPPSLAAIERAATILAEARKALGGPALEGLKTLTASGRTRRVRGNNLVPIEFEFGIELPDKYFRKDEFPAEETDPTSLGFNGDSLIQTPAPVAAPPTARAGGPPPPTPAQIEAQRKTRVTGVKQDFVRFALGMFATSFETYPLTFAFAAQAEAPQGKADVLDVTGAGGFKLRFLIHSETHLPIMVSWQLPPTNVIMRVPGQPPPATIAPGAVVVEAPAPPAATATQEEKDAYAKTVQGASGQGARHAGRASTLFRRLSRRERAQVALPAPPRHRRRHDGRNDVRPVSSQRKDRSATFPDREVRARALTAHSGRALHDCKDYPGVPRRDVCIVAAFVTPARPRKRRRSPSF